MSIQPGETTSFDFITKQTRNQCIHFHTCRLVINKYTRAWKQRRAITRMDYDHDFSCSMKAENKCRSRDENCAATPIWSVINIGWRQYSILFSRKRSSKSALLQNVTSNRRYDIMSMRRGSDRPDLYSSIKLLKLTGNPSLETAKAWGYWMHSYDEQEQWRYGPLVWSSACWSVWMVYERASAIWSHNKMPSFTNTWSLLIDSIHFSTRRSPSLSRCILAQLWLFCWFSSSQMLGHSVNR